jgi:chondroitin AC lyase
MNYKNYFLLCLFLFTSSMSKGQCDNLTGIALLRCQAYDVFKAEAPDNISTSSVIDWLGDQEANGSWSGTANPSYIDYTDTESDGGWDPMEHLERLADFAGILANYTDYQTQLGQNYPEAILENRIESGLDYWYSLNDASSCNPDIDDCATSCPWSDNWYHNHIGKQEQLQIIGILFYDYLIANNPDLLDDIIADFPDDIENCHVGNNDPYTGSNKTEVGVSLLIKGILDYGNNPQSNEQLIQDGVAAFECALVFASAASAFEGVQRDHTFHQHGPLLYNGGYGQTFVETISKWGAILANTDYDLSSTGKQFFFEYILDGYRWAVRGNTTDYSANGRYLSRKHPNNNAAIKELHMDWAISMAESDPNASSALTTMKNNSDMGEHQDIIGNTHFWKSDYVCHHEEDYFSSVKMCSNRTYGTESVNHENKLGYWLPFGCTFVYTQGNEYTNIFPYWDWAYVPGVTSPGNVPNFDHIAGNTLISNQSPTFVGSTNNIRYGVTAMKYEKDGISANKSWFHFGEEIIALGADISGSGLHTTLDQSIYMGSYSENEPGEPKWIQHNNIAYILPDDPDYFPSGQSWELTTNTENGNWNLINGDVNDPDDDEPASGDVFKLWVNHSGNNASSYYYIIAPGQDAESYAENNPVTILRNTAFIQAVKKVEADGDVLAGIVFYPGFLSVPQAERKVQVTPTFKLSTDKQCALLYDGNTGQVCISSPNRDMGIIQLIVFETINGTEVQLPSIVFDLPDGDDAGTSICMDLFDITKGNVARSYCSNEPGIIGVEIYESNTTTYPMSTTNSSGNFSIARLTTPPGGYTIDPKKNTDYLNGVTTFDALLIARHALGIQALNTPYKIIASDVSYDAQVTGYDIWQIQQLILHNHTEFSNVDSWEFVDASHVLNPDPFSPVGIPSPDWPWPFPQTIEVNSSTTDFDFVAVKMGDVNCSAINGLLPPCPEEVKILAEDKAPRQNDIFTLALRTENFDNIAAYQFALRFDATKLQYQNIQQGDLNRAAKPENFNLSTTNNGLIRTLWLYNDASNPAFTVIDTSLADYASLFLIQFKALQDIPALSDVINLSADDLPGGAWSDGEDCTRNVVMQFMPEGFADNRSSEQTDSENLSNKVRVHPNPTTGALSFEITTKIAAENIIQIYSTTGQQVLRKSVYLEKGNNTVPMEDISNWQDGLYHYVITVGDKVETGNFIKE